MFYPARMNSVVIGIHNRWLMKVTSALHEQGELEVIDLKKTAIDDVPRSPLEIPREDIESIIKLQFRLDRVIETLEPFEYKPEGIRSILFPEDRLPAPARFDFSDQVIKAAEEELESVSEVISTFEFLKKNRELQQVTRERIENLHRLKLTGIDLSYLAPAPFTWLVAGWMSKESLPRLEEWYSRAGTDEMFLSRTENGEEIIVLCIGTPATRSLLEELTHHAWFSRISLPGTWSGQAEAMIESEQSSLSSLAKEEEELTALLSSMAESHVISLRAVREELGIWRDRFEVSRNFGRSRDVVYLRGWIRQKDTDRLADLLRKVTDDEYFLQAQPAGSEDDVPVRYDNPGWLKPFEILTTTFSRPGYNEIDPTPFFAPAYLIFFGMMLGDAGYGVIIALVGWLLYQGPGRRDESFRDMSYILICCGVVDIILGTLQGGWFGDLLPRFFNVTPPFILIEPLNQPILLFQIALIIGTVHINLGIFLGFLQNFKNRHYKSAIADQGIWFILQPAAAVLLAEFFGWVTFSPIVKNIAIAFAITGLLILFVRNGPMGFFSLTGFLGDWLSYVRILALALATGGVAMTINILSEMIAAVHPYMLIPAILFCIAGQLFNLAIQTLGSVIHALRLHYIEFFGKFYSGGGKEFVPFYEQRMYTSVKREEMT